MLVAIDGAVKAPGTSACLSVGCALFVESTDDKLYKVICEPKGSTSQRGEINGLILALTEAVEKGLTDDILVILTDSQYLYDTVMGEWVKKWENANWITANSEPPKNLDQWQKVLDLIKKLEAHDVEITLVWTKGHLYRYPAGQITRCMQQDASGATLMSSITTLMSVASQRERAVENFNACRAEHDLPALPEAIAADYIVYNTTVDAIAVYCANLLKAHADAQSDDNK